MARSRKQQIANVSIITKATHNPQIWLPIRYKEELRTHMHDDVTWNRMQCQINWIDEDNDYYALHREYSNTLSVIRAYLWYKYSMPITIVLAVNILNK